MLKSLFFLLWPPGPTICGIVGKLFSTVNDSRIYEMSQSIFGIIQTLHAEVGLFGLVFDRAGDDN